MRAISVLILETGTSTRWCLAATALRMRVRKSPTGSVCIALLPTRFHHAGNFSAQGKTTKADSAHFKLPDIAAGAPANAAAIALAHLELGFLAFLNDLGRACHGLPCTSLSQWKSQTLQQFSALFVVFRCGGQGDIHALNFIHACVIDFGKHQLVPQTQGVIAPTIEGIG